MGGFAGFVDYGANYLSDIEDVSALLWDVAGQLSGKTGAEMEALTGVSVALLTVYDMCKALDRAMVINNIRLMEKSGGKSGHFTRDENPC